MKKLAMVLVGIGALNWGLVGLGWLIGGRDWNLVHLIFGFSMTLEAIIYVLVGLAAIKYFWCRCAACKGVCTTCSCHAGGAPKQM